MKNKLVIIALSFALISCQGGDSEEKTAMEILDVYLINPVGQPLKIQSEIADTPAKQRVGLMHRETLDSDKGMLFIFGRSFRLSFWMKNTLIPLDILFFDENMQLDSTKTMHPCQIQTCPYTRSDGPAKYALEVVSGFVVHHGIGPGWTLKYDQIRQ